MFSNHFEIYETCCVDEVHGDNSWIEMPKLAPEVWESEWSEILYAEIKLSMTDLKVSDMKREDVVCCYNDKLKIWYAVHPKGLLKARLKRTEDVEKDDGVDDKLFRQYQEAWK